MHDLQLRQYPVHRVGSWRRGQLDSWISCPPLTSLHTCLSAASLTPPDPCLLCHTDVDHNYWGRPEQQEAWLKSRNSLPRKTYIWTRAMAASDLMGMVRGRWMNLPWLCGPPGVPCRRFARQRGVTARPLTKEEVPAGWRLLSRAGPGAHGSQLASWLRACGGTALPTSSRLTCSPACPPFAVQRGHDICQHAAEDQQPSLLCRATHEVPGAVRLGQEQAG